MSKMKIEVKMTNKNKITGMRKLPDKRVSVATVIITYLKDSSPFNKKEGYRMRIRFRLSVLQKLF